MTLCNNCWEKATWFYINKITGYTHPCCGYHNPPPMWDEWREITSAEYELERLKEAL